LISSCSRNSYVTQRDRLSFPTRRSSDLGASAVLPATGRTRIAAGVITERAGPLAHPPTMILKLAVCRMMRPSATTKVSVPNSTRSEEHTSELQSREKLVCRLLPEKKTDQ